MLTLLSPAKTLNESPYSNGLPATSPQFEADSKELLKRCRELTAADLGRLMKISEPLAQLNEERFRSMSFPFSPDNAKPCILAFRGDVYRGLDVDSLSTEELVYAQDHLRILSGFYGILRPLDLMQPYRLEMGTRLSNERGNNLYEFWGDRLVESLNAEHAQRPVSAVLNLASNEYFKAVRADKLEPRLINVAFQEIRDGRPKTIAVYAKKARGLMARFQIQKRIEDPEGLKGFDTAGYAFNPDLSGEDELVFTRDSA